MASIERFDGAIIIGSGPTGVSVAWPLVHAGMHVLMLEAGKELKSTFVSERPDLMSLRVSENDSDYIYRSGIENSAFGDNEFISPKLRLNAPANLIKEFRNGNECEVKNFKAVGAFCLGGLSNFWGGACAEWTANDLTDIVDHQEMVTSYKNISERMSISGSSKDAMSSYFGDVSNIGNSLELSKIGKILLEKFQRKEGLDFRLGRPRLAVASESKGNFRACSYCKSCMYGCDNGSIYNAAVDVERLKKFENFNLRVNSFVTSFKKEEGLYVVELADGKKIKSPILILAAGVISTARLYLSYKQSFGKRLRMLTNPAFSFSIFIPSMFGSELPKEGFSLAQLAFMKDMPEKKSRIFGMLYDADSFPVSDLILHSPFTIKGSKIFFRETLSSLMLGMGYLPGCLSESYISLNRERKIVIESNQIDKLEDYRKIIIRNLRKDFLNLGAFLLPGTLRFFEPGSEVHYAGTLPIGKVLDGNCAVQGDGNLYVADSSSLPSLSEKPHTYTAMANADRVGRMIVKKYGSTSLHSLS